MTVLVFTLAVWAMSTIAGFLGSLTGLGGGVVVVPVLALALGVDIKYAIGASLVSVIATSSGAAAAYVKEGYSNIRIGMLLEIATTLGALLGAFLTAYIGTHAIAIIFGLVLIQAAYQSIFNSTPDSGAAVQSDPLAKRLRLGGTYPVDGRRQEYGVRNVPAGFGLMFGAGTLSGLLGIGSGAVKVIAMDRAMKIPVQGVHHDQQLHDRRHRRGQRRRLPQPRIHRSARRNAGDAGCAWRSLSGNQGPRACAAYGR